jgi:anti-sigma-K factor RskA
VSIRGGDEMPVDIHTLAGAYALDAVDDDEREMFERHLAGCEACRAEVASLRETAALLGASRPAAPPPGLRAAVLEAAGNTRQDRPVVEHPAAERHSRVPTWAARWAPVAAAVLLIATLGLGGALVVNGQRLDDAQSRADQLAGSLARLTAVTTVAVPGGGSVRMTRGESAALVELVGVPAPPPGRTYELWLVPADGKPVAAGLLRHAGARAYVADLGDAAAVAVTEEPAGGSKAPTTNPFAVLPLRA